MKTNFSLGKELDEKNEVYQGKDDFLGVDILTLSNKTDSVRATMFANMLQQGVCIDNAEPPRMFTRYENQVGKYSSSYFKTKNPIKVIEKIKKFKNSDNYYVLVYQDLTTKEYNILEVKLAEHLTESYCYLNDNKEVNKLEKGNKVEADKVLYHSNNFDDYGNYSYGLNAKACFMIYNDTIEDAILISESFAKRMSFNYLHEVPININTNDLLVNLYGDDNEFKSFPEIGEETRGKVLTSRRRINYENALFDLKDEQLKNINYSSDTIFYAKGKLIDLDIYSNVSIDELRENKYNEQIVRYLEQQEEFYTRIVEVLKPIIEGGKKFSDDLSYLYRRARDIINPNIKWKNDKTDFDNLVIVFKVLENNPLHVGSKIAGRYGNKGVVSKILPDEEMPVAEDGTRAEMILNALGVCNRLNPSQLYEQEINFISDNVLKDMKKMKLNDAKNFYFDYLKDVNKTQYKETKAFFKSLSKENKVNFMKEILKKGISVHQPPFWGNIDFKTLGHLYDKYGYKPYNVTIDGKSVENPIIISDLYMIRLKHEPKSKMSVRSTSFINMKNVPSKSLNYKKHEEPYSKTPIRIGEMELVNLLLTKDSKIQAKFNSFYSNNEMNRQEMNRILLSADNVLDIEKLESKNTENSSKVLLDVLFKTLSIKLRKRFNKKE